MDGRGRTDSTKSSIITIRKEGRKEGEWTFKSWAE